jgi:hypothetical protein
MFETGQWRISGERVLPSPLPAALVESAARGNIFPAVEGVDVRDAGRDAEVVLGTKIEGELTPVTIKLSYEQAKALADLLEPFRKS